MPKRGQRIESRLPSSERLDAFVAMIRSGSYITTVCQATGISKTAYFNWVRESNGPNPRPAVVTFVHRCQVAEARAETDLVEVVVREAQEGDWRAAIALLGRRFPARWGPSATLAVDVTVSEHVTTREQLDEALEQLGLDIAADFAIETEAVEVEADVLPIRHRASG